MEDGRADFQPVIDPNRYGVSFSLKQCRNFSLDPEETLRWLLEQSWRRFRLMSYWDEHEKSPGTYDFSALDRQLQLIAEAGGEVTLCLGVKQPRWPEYHWPDWAWQLDKPARDDALIGYVQQVVARYGRWQVVTSWQLENEALLRGFGKRIDIDRERLQREYAAVRQLDPVRPIAMSTSNGWGIPARQPWPDAVGFSLYTIMHKKGRYHRTIQKPWLYRLRKHFVHVLLNKAVFIHELQCEPWGPKAIWQMTPDEQEDSMDTDRLRANLMAAQKVHSYPIDLWGAEWWYSCHRQGEDSIWHAVQGSLD